MVEHVPPSSVPQHATLVSTFTQMNREGRTLQGATLRIEKPLVMVRHQAPDDAPLVPVHGGCLLTALFGPLRLEELTLELFLTLSGAQALYAAYGQVFTASGGLVPTDRPQMKGQLRLSEDELVAVAKTVPPVGQAAERLAVLANEHPYLMQELDCWEFRGARLR